MRPTIAIAFLLIGCRTAAVPADLKPDLGPRVQIDVNLFEPDYARYEHGAVKCSRRMTSSQAAKFLSLLHREKPPPARYNEVCDTLNWQVVIHSRGEKLEGDVPLGHCPGIDFTRASRAVGLTLYVVDQRSLGHLLADTTWECQQELRGKAPN
jgi:hypothetical protein